MIPDPTYLMSLISIFQLTMELHFIIIIKNWKFFRQKTDKWNEKSHKDHMELIVLVQKAQLKHSACGYN